MLYLCSKVSSFHKQTLVESGDDVSLKLLRDRAKKQRRKLISKEREKIQEAEAEAEMQELCRIKDKIARLQDILRRFPNHRCRRADTSSLDESLIVFVPVAQLQEKR